MKKITLIICLLATSTLLSQVAINANFSGGLPAGWSGNFSSTTTQSCEGISFRRNIYVSAQTGNLTTSNQVGASDGTEITFSIDYKVVDWSAATNPTTGNWGTARLQYSTNNGTTWITAGTINGSNDSGLNTCTTFSVTIPGASVPVGSNLRFRVSNTWAAGDYYFYIDNFVAEQAAVASPGTTCGTALAVTPGTITGTTITPGTGSAQMAPTGADSAWFIYSATADGTIDVNSCFGNADTDLSIGGGACGAFTNVINDDDTCDLGNGNLWASEILGYPVVNGEVYYIEWSNEWSAGPFNWTLTFTPTAVISSFPYTEDFDSGSGGWSADNTTNGSWQLGAPTNTIINSAASGTDAWVTNLNGFYSDNDDSAVVSPLFDFTTLTNPAIALSIWYNSEFSWDGMVLQSSINNGVSWQNVGNLGDLNNWYNDDTIAGGPGNQQIGWTGRNSTGNGSGGWLVASNTLTGLAGQSNVLLRVAFGSDGSVVDEGVAFDTVIVYEDAPTTYTYTSGTWAPFNPMGIASSDDDVIIAAGDIAMSANLSCNTMTANPGTGLTINSGVTLITNNLTLESTSTSYSSLIVDGTVTGNVNYERYVNSQSNRNDLISAPLSGQTFGDFAAANPNIFSNPSNPSQKLFGPWSKTANQYIIYDTDIPAEANIVLGGGTGYRAASTGSGGTFTFNGSVNTGTVSENIVFTGPFEAEWNLVGNPYPSYLNVQDFLNHEVDTGVKNLNLFNPPTAAIYGYDGDVANGGWIIYNLATTSASTVIAPGQGFFVSADPTQVAAYDLEFTSAMRSTGTSDDFFPGRNAELIYITLNLSNNTKAYKTDFYFNTNASLGFDVGYDAAIWGGNAPEFSIYSHLVQNNANDAIALQTLNYSDISNVTIPLGVHANQGEQITFSIADMNIPASVNVYLEDVLTNTVTLLNTSDYIITPTTALSGTGRFFLRTSEDALSTIHNTLDNLTIIALNASKELVVSGQLKNNTTLYIYDIQGRNVFSTQLDSTNLKNRINVSNINTGVYIVTVKNNKEQKTQKVIIN